MTNEEIRNKFKCPGCGAEISATDLQCKSCGFEIPKSGITGEVYIKELQDKIWKCENDASRIANTISTFTMPNDIEHLLEFFRFCDANFEQYLSTVEPYFSDKSETDESFVLSSAWGIKAQSIYERLKYANDGKIKDIIKNYASKYNSPENIRKIISKKRRIKTIPHIPAISLKFIIKRPLRTLGLIFLFIIFVGLIQMGIDGYENIAKEKETEEFGYIYNFSDKEKILASIEAEKKSQEFIKLKDLDKALIYAELIEFQTDRLSDNKSVLNAKHSKVRRNTILMKIEKEATDEAIKNKAKEIREAK